MRLSLNKRFLQLLIRGHAGLGSLPYPTGEGLYTIYARKRHQEFRAYPEALHTVEPLDDVLEAHQDRVALVFQPSYRPHLNLIERLWRLMCCCLSNEDRIFLS